MKQLLKDMCVGTSVGIGIGGVFALCLGTKMLVERIIDHVEFQREKNKEINTAVNELNQMLKKES